MGIPESKFGDWNSTGADVGSKRARQLVYNGLRGDRSPLEQKEDDYKVFLQGSYANTTHTRGSSDIDVVAKQKSAWTYDLSELSTTGKERYHRDHSPAKYAYKEFRQDVLSAVKTKFGAHNVSWDSKAIKVSKEGTSLPVEVDVIPCTEHRVYHSYPEQGEPVFTSGMFFMPRMNSETIINYPKLHIANGEDKSKRTSQNYKETVRIFKNARDYVDDHRSLFSFEVPSYYIECLLYNVDDDLFRVSRRSDRFIGIVEALEGANLDSFHQQSEMMGLLGSDSTQWSKNSANEFIDEMRMLWDEW